jgi:hypothetical protein
MSPLTEEQRRAKHWLIGCLIILAVLVVVPLSFLAGACLAEYWHYQRDSDAERSLLEPVLASRPEYKSVTISEYSAGYVMLYGSVPTEMDFERLKLDVIEALGKRRMEHRFMNVSVGNKE